MQSRMPCDQEIPKVEANVMADRRPPPVGTRACSSTAIRSMRISEPARDQVESLASQPNRQCFDPLRSDLHEGAKCEISRRAITLNRHGGFVLTRLLVVLLSAHFAQVDRNALRSTKASFLGPPSSTCYIAYEILDPYDRSHKRTARKGFNSSHLSRTRTTSLACFSLFS